MAVSRFGFIQGRRKALLIICAFQPEIGNAFIG
jgi:hypothetical protein